MSSFNELHLAEPLLRALSDAGYSTPTPIQAGAIPHLLAGRDLLGLAQTGTGKTAAFALPILHRMSATPLPAPKLGARAVVLAPTRELATQIEENFAVYGRHLSHTHTVVFGGVGQGKQVEALRRGVDVLVAAPGRLLDLMEQGHANLAKTEFLVLDEADRMLDMGFVRDIRRIVDTMPSSRQTMLFSATMPSAIATLSNGMLRDPVRIEVSPPSTTVERIRQLVMFVDAADKRSALLEMVQSPRVSRAVVFTLMKHEANKVAEFLTTAGVNAEAIHGNKSQPARDRAMSGFRAGSIKVLVATDIASRGIDVDDVSHVFNYDLPNIPETYVHRIGRTARAGREGWAVSLCDATQRAWLREIEREIGTALPVFSKHRWHNPAAQASTLPAPVLGGNRQGRGSGPHHAPRQSQAGAGPSPSRGKTYPGSGARRAGRGSGKLTNRQGGFAK